MPNKERKLNNKKRSGRTLASFRRLGLLSLALVMTSCIAPSHSAQEDGASTSDGGSSSIHDNGNSDFNGAQALAQSLTNSLASGFKLSLNQASLKADENNEFDFSGGSLSFSLSQLSLHGLSVGLNAPVNYNGIGQRSIDATLVDDELYFALSCPKESGDPYSVAYKVSTASYIYDVNGESHDSTTGGVYQYEFGRLDWIIDDILQILSGYGYSISPKTENSSVTFDWGKISASLDELSEISAGSRYFLWNLPLGDKTYPIGLQGDEDYSLSGIDFPAKGVSGASGELPNGMTLSFSSSFESEGISILPPNNASSYLTLDNSIDLWERLANYAGKLSFSVSSQHVENGVVKDGLLLTHKEDAVEETETSIGHQAIDESAVFNIEGSGDFKGGKVNALNAKASFLSESESKYLSANVTDGDEEKNICLDVNGIVKARTSKTTADAFFSAFSNLLGDESISNKYLSNLLSAANSISAAMDSIKDSQVAKDISEGHYEHLLAIISKLEVEDNQITLTLDLSKAGSAGTLTLLLLGKDKNLAEITFSGFTLGYFGVEGTLSIGDYVASSFNPSEYPLMDHLPSLNDQVEDLFQSHSAKATIQGYILDKDTQAVSSDTRFASIGGKSSIIEQGFSFEGSLAFNLKEKVGSGSGIFLDRKADYLNEHAISIEIDGDEENNGNMLFGYNSKNSMHNSGAEGYKDLDYGNITEPDSDVGSMYGKFTVASLNDLLECFSTLLNSTDPRFTKFTSAKDTIATTLIAKLAQGQIAPLLTEKILLSCVKNGDVIDAVVSKTLFGSETDINLRLGFNDNGLSLIRVSFSTEEKEMFFNINIEVPEKELTKSEILIDELEEKRSIATDYSDLPTLVDYLLGSATLGEDENHQSTYHISGSASLSFGFSLNVNIDAFIALRGAEILAMGSVTVPMVVGVNTSNLFGGTQYCEFYYHTSGTDQDGTIFFHRTKDINSLFSNDEEDYAKVKASDFSANIGNWLLGYVVGMTDSTMESITGSSSKDEKGSSLHGEELIRSYSFTQESGGAKWGLSLDLSSLSSVLSDQIALTIQGKEVNANGTKEKTLSSISGSTKILSILNVSFSFSLANVSSGDYKAVWIRNSSSEDDIIGIAYLTSKKRMASQKVHAADYYSEIFYNEGYLTSGVFASAKYYTEKYTG